MRLTTINYILLLTCLATIISCNEKTATTDKKVRLITLDPGHFHAALVQKSMYPDVDSVVKVYAPAGPDLQLHLDRINSYNNRNESPTRWKEDVYTGPDFFEKMIAEKKGNVVVLSGNNQKKTDYILQSLENGLHVFADKPMLIHHQGFEKLKKAFDIAAKNKVLLYDIMTERYEITTVLQRALSQLPAVFGTLEKGTPDNPAITKESVHHFYKFVSGSVLTRPSWFMDVTQQGEGIVDVMTHLVDLVQWECFPEQIIDYTNDLVIDQARRWSTPMTLSEFSAITKQPSFPDYFTTQLVQDSVLPVYCNGEINYRIRGIHAKTSVIWNYKAPDGTGDTHYSIMRGSNANLVIRQGKEENFKPTLYIEFVGGAKKPEKKDIQSQLNQQFPGIKLIDAPAGWTAQLPEALKEGHEAHFARVTEKFLSYLDKGELPAWEVPNMLAKYYLTTKALETALLEKK